MRTLARLFAVVFLILTAIPFMAPQTARAQDFQSVTNAPFQRLHTITFRLEGYRYENVGTSNPAVVIYGNLRNDGRHNFALRADTFQNSRLTDGSVTQSGGVYTFPPGVQAGQLGSFSDVNLPAGGARMVAFRFRAPGGLGPRDYILTLTAKDPNGSGSATITIPAYGRMSRPLPAEQLQTPAPVYAASGVGGDGAFTTSGPWRIRMDEVVYGAANRPERGLTRVLVTIQNTFSVPLTFKSGSAVAHVIQSDNVRTRQDSQRVIGGMSESTDETVAPGQSIRAEFIHYLADHPAQHRAQSWQMVFTDQENTPRSFTVRLPQPNMGSTPIDTSKPPKEPHVTETIRIPEGQAQRLGRFNVRATQVEYNAVNSSGERGIVHVMVHFSTPDEERLETDSTILSTRLNTAGAPIPEFRPDWLRPWNIVVTPISPRTHTFWFRVGDEAARSKVQSITLTEAGQGGGSVTLSLPPPGSPDPGPSQPTPSPPTPTPTPPPTQPTYDAPAAPAPNTGAEQDLRALAGDWTVGAQGTMTLRYEAGLLVGELWSNGPNGQADAVKLTLDAEGELVGTVQRPTQPPWQTWMTAAWTPSADGQRLQGQNKSVHMPNTPPANIDATRKAGGPQTPTEPTTPQPQPQSPSIDLSRFAGEFTTSRGHRLTLTAAGSRLTGRAVDQNGLPQETLTLDHAEGGRFTGQWRQMTMNGLEGGQVNLSFADSAESFSGDVQWTTGPMGPAIEYTGSRGRGDAATPGEQGPTGSAAGGGGFQPTAYLDMKVDRVTRSPQGLRVFLTARNAEDVRRGIGHDTQDYSVIGSDGSEYRSDGNIYTHEGPLMQNTVWMAKDAQGTVAYLFPLPPEVTATQLVLRERYDQRRRTTFSLPAL